MLQVRKPHVSDKRTICGRSEDLWYWHKVTRPYVADKKTACEERLWQVIRPNVTQNKTSCGRYEDHIHSKHIGSLEGTLE